MTSLKVYNLLDLSIFSVAWYKVNQELLYPQTHPDKEIKAKLKQEDKEHEEFMDLVISLKEDREWWNTCSSLRDRGYHAEVNEALSIAEAAGKLVGTIQ